MKEIKLTRGQVAIVDAEDYDELMKYEWCASPYDRGYYAIRGGKKGEKRTIRMHRQILGLTDRSVHVDHVNNNGLDNRRCNIRKCTPSENMRNKRASRGSISKYVGVSYRSDRDRWVSTIAINGKSIHGGYFKTEIEAALDRDKLAVKHFGDFAFINIK